MLACGLQNRKTDLKDKRTPAQRLRRGQKKQKKTREDEERWPRRGAAFDHQNETGHGICPQRHRPAPLLLPVGAALPGLLEWQGLGASSLFILLLLPLLQILLSQRRQPGSRGGNDGQSLRERDRETERQRQT